LVGEKISPWIGLWCEREFDGDIKGSENGVMLDVPSLKGWSGIMELGLSFKPSYSVPGSIVLSGHGDIGNRKGASGSLALKMEF
jgi:hypothetical protein